MGAFKGAEVVELRVPDSNGDHKVGLPITTIDAVIDPLNNNKSLRTVMAAVESKISTMEKQMTEQGPSVAVYS